MPLQKNHLKRYTRLLLVQIVVFLMTSYISPLHAAPINERTMVNLTLTDGLAGETVRKVMTDHNGYTWIATTGGVSIFNGEHLMSIHIQNDKGRALDVFDLCETADHTIYAATEGGLYRLSIASDGFEHFLPEVTRPITLLAAGDTLYIGGEQGMQIWDGESLKQRNIGASRKGLDNIVRHYIRDERGFIWFLGRHDLYRYDPKTSHVDYFDLIATLTTKPTLAQFDKVGSKFFIGSRNKGLFVYDLSTGQSHFLNGVGHVVTSVRKTSDGLIAVATDGTGAYLIDPQTEQVMEHFSMSTDKGHRLPTNALYHYYRDNNQVDWLGMVRHGLVYKPHVNTLFQPYEHYGLATAGMNVRSFFIRGSQSVIGLQNGLWFIDSLRQVRHWFSPNELGGHIVNNIVWWQGQYVIGMYDGGVHCLDPQTLQLIPFPSHHFSLNNPFEPLATTTVGAIKVNPQDSTLWIGCSDGLFIIDHHGEARRFTEQNSHIVGGVIINITFDRQGNAWLTGAKGVSLYSAASQMIVETNFPDGFFNKEPYMRGILGHDGLIYMRNGPQLFYTTSNMERFGELSIPLRLTDRWCRGMVDDGRGRLWLASERGLLSVDYEGRNLIQIGEGEGLMGGQISEVLMDAQQMLWVATSSGLYSASLKDINRWRSHTQSKMTLYNVRVGSDLLDINEQSRVTEQHKIRLKWNFSSQPLQAEPLLLDYARHQSRLYEYRVDGNEWQIVENGKVLDVRHLLLGTHQLTIRMAGVEGTETTYTLILVPSFWFFFELALFIIAIVALWLWWHLRKNTKVLVAERNEIEDALIESEELRVKSEEFATALQESGSVETLQKYQKVKVDETECADIVKRMKEYLERERVFTNADLKMKDLADVLHLSAPKLSQVFNLYLGENYYDFINRYRLEEFKRLIEAGEYKRFTITALSEQCGFKKSNFFSTFRKVEGATPAEYLKKQGIKV